jgi:GDP-D-mannose dehydratase
LEFYFTSSPRRNQEKSGKRTSREPAFLPYPLVGKGDHGKLPVRQVDELLTEVEHLVADASKARRVLGWTPKTSFGGLVKIMMDADLKRLKEVLK